MIKSNKNANKISNHLKFEGEINPNLGNLKIYNKAKLGLSNQLRIVREALTTLGLEQSERKCGELVVKLAEDRFTLAVLGQFNRGKSSFMNAIIGQELLPIGVLPLTSAITVLKYGPKERLVITRINSPFPDELPVSFLSDYVTEKGNPGNQKKLKTACVEIPIPFLRRGIEFVDTPGIGSAIVANSATTYSYLAECDAVVFVTSADMPMTSLELNFLREISEYVNKIFFVINKIDLVADGERDNVIQFVTETIKAQIGGDTVKVFPLSALWGLAARKAGDKLLYDQSGLKAVEESLALFLTNEKQSIFLGAVAYKALKILNDETLQGAFEEDAINTRAKVIQNEKPLTIRRDPYSALETLNAAHRKIEALYLSLFNGQRPVDVEILISPSILSENRVVQGPLKEESMFLDLDIEADLQTKGCPVCKHAAEQVLHFFTHWQYQISADEKAQTDFAEELGFCPLHTWQLLAVSSPYGASIGFTRLVEHVAIYLRKEKNSSAKGKTIGLLVHNSQNCRVCNLVRKVEMEYIKQLAAFMAESVGQNKYRLSQGACLRHLGMLVDASSEDICEFLITHAAQRFEEDAEDMQSYALKRDALLRSLHNRNEEDAYRRAITRLIGGRSLSIPWAEDREI